MSRDRLLRMVLLMIRQFRDPYYQGFAAQLAFYFILSIVPIMIVLSQILGLFSVSLDVLSELITHYVSDEVAEILDDFITYSPTGAMNMSFVIIALWSASKVQFSMMRMANYTNTDGQSTGKGYFRDRLRAVRTILITLFTVTFALIIIVYGEPIFKLFLRAIYRTLNLEYEIDKVILFFRWPAAAAMYFLMVSYNYFVLPYEKVKFRSIIPGSVFASLTMLAATYLYSGYTKYAAHFDIIYGSLASVVAMMFWFFFLSWALGMGILFNKVYRDTAENAISD